MFFFCDWVDVVQTVFAVVNATVGDHEFFVAVEEGFVDQMCSSWGLNSAGWFRGSGWEGSFVEADVSTIDNRVRRQS